MISKKLAVIALSGLLATGVAVADKKDKKNFNFCSPGFWKNHTELWVDADPLLCQGDECTLILDALKSRGPGSGNIRMAAVLTLNNWADDYYGYVVCPAND